MEKNEINILNDISKKNNLPLSIILISCDKTSEDQINTIENNIKQIDKNIDVIKVCSLSYKTSIDKASEPFGEEACIQKILSVSYEMVGKSLIKNVCEELINFIIGWRNKTYEKIDKSDIFTFDMEFDEEEMNKALSPLFELKSSCMKHFITKSIISYHTAINDFDVDWQGKEIFDETFENIMNAIEVITTVDFEKMTKKIEANIEAIMEKQFEDISSLEDINLFELFKTEIKQGLNEIFDKVIVLLEKYV